MVFNFKVDVQPATGFSSEVQLLLPPLSASVRVLRPPSLFAGKVHAVLFRRWGNRVKGRDFYDLLWYLGRRIPLRLKYLQAKMVEGGDWAVDRPLTRMELVALLRNRFKEVDFDSAGREVAPFLHNPTEVTVWSSKFFDQAIESLVVEESLE